tara:strand:- start:262 stop:537 length:276 start_codon:yes stop_codon:yes gene_type:complete
MDSLAKDPLLTKGSLDDKVGATPTAGSFGLKKDGIFIEEKDKKDDNKKSISEQLKEKMRKESEQKDETKEEKKEVQPPVVQSEENKVEEKK